MGIKGLCAKLANIFQSLNGNAPSDEGIPMSVFAPKKPDVKSYECREIAPMETTLGKLRGYIPTFPDIAKLPAQAETRIYKRDSYLFGEKGPILTMNFHPDPGIGEWSAKAFLENNGFDSPHLSYRNKSGCAGTFSLFYAVPGHEDNGYRLEGTVYGSGEDTKIIIYPPSRAVTCRDQEGVDSQIRIALTAMKDAFPGMAGQEERPPVPSP